MSDKLGHLTFGKKHHQVFLGRDIAEERNYSEDTALKIDNEVSEIVDTAYKRAEDLLKKKKSSLTKLSEKLIEKEVLTASEAREVAGLPEPKKDNSSEDKEKKDAAKDSKVPPVSA